MNSLSLDNGVKVSTNGGSINITADSVANQSDSTELPTADSLWQISYDDVAETFYIIGVIDIDSSKTAEQHNFVLQNEDVYFRREGDTLVLTPSAN
ncbi:MAG: hypothetical protein AAGG75_26245 [Bacteroidota bacterium]